MDLLEKANAWADEAEELADNYDFEQAYSYKELEVNCLREVISEYIDENCLQYERDEDDNYKDAIDENVGVSKINIDFDKQTISINLDTLKNINYAIECLNDIKKSMEERG